MLTRSAYYSRSLLSKFLTVTEDMPFYQERHLNAVIFLIRFMAKICYGALANLLLETSSNVIQIIGTDQFSLYTTLSPPPPNLDNLLTT